MMILVIFMLIGLVLLLKSGDDTGFMMIDDHKKRWKIREMFRNVLFSPSLGCNPWIQTKILTNYETHTLAIRWCTVNRQGKVFSFPTTTNFFVDLDLSKILFHQHPLPQLKFMMQRIKISKLLVIAFRKHMTSHGLPTLRDVRVQRHRHSGNLRVSATDWRTSASKNKSSSI